MSDRSSRGLSYRNLRGYKNHLLILKTHIIFLSVTFSSTELVFLWSRLTCLEREYTTELLQLSITPVNQQSYDYSKSRVQCAKCRAKHSRIEFLGTIPVIICWNTSGKHARHKLSRFMNTRTAFRPFPQCWFHARLLRHKRFRNQH